MPAPTPCPWPRNDLDRRYHDTEWGVPLYDDRALFELLILEGAQAGLSWSIVLAKREHYREAFDGFDPARIARYTPAKVARLLQNPGIVRNRLKVAATISNAQAYLALRDTGTTLADFLWAFPDPTGRRTPIINRPARMADIPSRTPLSDAMSKALSKRGFRFVGSTIMYAFMQASGMVNDHLQGCPRAPRPNRP